MVETDRRYKILLADDEPQNIKNLFETLNPDLYRVFVASDGKSAVEQALKYLPDAIIMDWDMPEMDGMTAIGIIRANDSIKDIPIIVATGKMTGISNLRTALEAGANDYIRKPFDPLEIEARVNSMIRLRMEQQKSVRLEKEIMQRKLDEARYEMEINQQALAAAKLRLINYNKYIEGLIDELRSIGNPGSDAAEKKIFDLISALRVNHAATGRTEFVDYFEKVHPSFFVTLHQRFPGLSSSECELCAFIKLNMTNQEITSITFKSDNTLKKARQRLKKKFGLQPTDSLYGFILEFE